jgi:hypothetical protein
MIFTFLLGLAAGALTPFAEPFVRQALENVALSKISPWTGARWTF